MPKNSIYQLTDNGRLCIPCKGRLWCGLDKCPILEQINIVAPKAAQIKREMFGPSMNLFVGHSGYPDVFAGPMVSYDDSVEKENFLLYDDPSNWFGRPASQIIGFRAGFARGMKRAAVAARQWESGGEYSESELALTAMAARPVDLEVSFAKTPQFRLSFSDIVQPMGPSERYDRMRIASNVSIPSKVDSLIGENLAVREALPELLQANLGFYYVQKILSAGVLGKKGRKRMVPTRWSITATDRMIADHYLCAVREFEPVSDFLVYSGEYLDNHFEILLLPGCWEFEQFESWEKGAAWNVYGDSTNIAHEYEPYEGRSDYAESEGGGYYAGRLGAAEALFSMRRQGKVVIMREIGPEYKIPVGVWEVRENARNAFKEGPVARFSELKGALDFLKARLKNDFGAYLSKSRIMAQSRLSAFF
jgi:hypothetical protein